MANIKDIHGNLLLLSASDILIPSLGVSLAEAIIQKLLPAPDYVTEQVEGLESKVARAVGTISSVTVDVATDDTGMSHAEGAYQDGVLAITLYNVKGDKGDALTFEDLTDEQKAELKGEKMTFADLTEEEKNELRGAKGEGGKSAYDLAVENGFVGTETEWLASQKGEKGEPGTDGKNGADGHLDNVVQTVNPSDTANAPSSKAVADYVAAHAGQGGGDSIEAGDNVTIDTLPNGKKRISAQLAGGTAQAASEVSYTDDGTQTNVQDKLDELNALSKYEVVLPNYLYLCKGVEAAMYANALTTVPIGMETDINAPEYQAVNYGRFYVKKPLAGGYGTVKYSEYTPNLTEIQKNVMQVILDPATRTGSSINVLALGDSYTDMGYWLDSIKDHCDNDGISINYIGLMPSEQNNVGVFSEHQSGGTLKKCFMSDRSLQTGLNYGGKTYKISVSGLVSKKFSTYYNRYETYKHNGVTWTITGFKLDSNGDGYIRITSASNNSELAASGTLTKIDGLYGDETIQFFDAEIVNRNPLWDNAHAKYSLKYYIEKWGLLIPQLLLLQFSWNDYDNKTENVEAFVADIKEFIAAAKSEYPNIKVVFSIEPFGYAKNASRKLNETKKARLQLAKRLFEEYPINNNSVIHIVPSYLFVDNILGFDTKTVTPLARYPNYSIDVARDEVHCNESGMRQIGDAVYPYVVLATPKN